MNNYIIFIDLYGNFKVAEKWKNTKYRFRIRRIVKDYLIIRRRRIKIKIGRIENIKIKKC